MRLFLVLVLILGILGIAFGAIMQCAFNLLTLPVACVSAVGVGCIVGSVTGLTIMWKEGE